MTRKAEAEKEVKELFPSQEEGSGNGGSSQGALVAALIAARRSFKPVLKTKTNPFFKSKYADLDAVCAATDQALSENGLVVLQYMDCGELVPTERKFGVVEVTDKDGQIERVLDVIEAKGPACFLVTELAHTSGEVRTSRYPISPGLDPQALGSSITYARRYALMAILGIAAEDDDGNSASGRYAPKKETIGPGQVDTLIDLIADVGADESAFLKYMGVSRIEDVLVSQYQLAKSALEKKRAKA